MSSPANPSAPEYGPAYAAYTVGRYGPRVGEWLDMFRDELRFNMPPEGGRRSRPPRLARLRAGLRRLAVDEVVRPAVLVEVHRAADALARVNARLWRERQFLSDSQPRTLTDGEFKEFKGRLLARVARVYRGIRVLVYLTERLVVLGREVSGRDVSNWVRLGIAVGRARRACRNAASGGVRPPQKAATLVRNLANRLAMEGGPKTLSGLASFPSESTDDSKPFLHEASRSYLCRLELARLDQNLACELRDRVPSGPVLTLGPKRLVYAGQECNASAFPHTEWCVLWTLAAHAQEWIDRPRIRAEAGVQSSPDELPVIISRLRRNILQAFDSPRVTTSRPSLADLIEGVRSNTPHSQGPYRLALAPSSVRIEGPSPVRRRGPGPV